MLALTSIQTASHVEPQQLLNDIRDALTQPAPSDPLVGRVPLTARDQASVAFPLRAPGVPAYLVRVESTHFLQPRVITYVLHDEGIGARLAVMDGAFLASLATGCVAALRASEGAVVGVVGAGEAAASAVWMLTHLRRVDTVLVHDARAERAQQLAQNLSRELGVATHVATREEATRAPVVLDDAELLKLDTGVAECVAAWHAYTRTRG